MRGAGRVNGILLDILCEFQNKYFVKRVCMIASEKLLQISYID